MSIELLMLAYSVALFFVIILSQAGLAIGQNGLQAQAGSRDNLPEPTVVRQRMHAATLGQHAREPGYVCCCCSGGQRCRDIK